MTSPWITRDIHDIDDRIDESHRTMTLRAARENFVTIAVGLSFVAMGLYGYGYLGRHFAPLRETSGIVVELVYETGTKKGRIHPVVRYKTADGQEIVAQSHEHHNLQPGQAVTILYDPAHPRDIDITTLARIHNQRVLFVVLSVLVGIVTCCFGLGWMPRKWQTLASREPPHETPQND